MSKKLQGLIDRTAKASRSFQLANSELMEYCLEVYGFEPGDVDADAIIDGVLGGDGMPNGMSAKEFDAIMRSSM